MAVKVNNLITINYYKNYAPTNVDRRGKLTVDSWYKIETNLIDLVVYTQIIKL